MFSYWLNLVGIYTSFWNIAILMVNCFMLSENRFQIAISFSRISMYITLWRNVVYCKLQKIFTVCVFQYFHNQIVGCFFINTNNQGFVQQGSSLFFKTHMWKIHFIHLHYALNNELRFLLSNGTSDFMTHSLSCFQGHSQFFCNISWWNSMFGVYSSKDEIKPRY